MISLQYLDVKILRTFLESKKGSLYPSHSLWQIELFEINKKQLALTINKLYLCGLLEMKMLMDQTMQK